MTVGRKEFDKRQIESRERYSWGQKRMKVEREDSRGLKRQKEQRDRQTGTRERERYSEKTDMGVKELDKRQIER